jgi:hypothetical protein
VAAADRSSTLAIGGAREVPGKSLRNVTHEYVLHYHKERNHQGLDNRIIETGEEVRRREGTIECREKLSGLLRYYYRDAV